LSWLRDKLSIPAPFRLKPLSSLVANKVAQPYAQEEKGTEMTRTHTKQAAEWLQNKRKQERKRRSEISSPQVRKPSLTFATKTPCTSLTPF
jgi:hypothetical protein